MTGRMIRAGMTAGLLITLTGCMQHDWHGSTDRHRAAMMGGIPDVYLKQARMAGDVEAGQALYRQNCVACHGEAGRGDGPAGANLDPRPADLTRFGTRGGGRMAGLLTWAIAEGGKAYGTAMPAYKESLSPSQIQDLVAYIRRGF